jgi:hypothetical protein
MHATKKWRKKFVKSFTVANISTAGKIVQIDATKLEIHANQVNRFYNGSPLFQKLTAM